MPWYDMKHASLCVPFIFPGHLQLFFLLVFHLFSNSISFSLHRREYLHPRENWSQGLSGCIFSRWPCYRHSLSWALCCDGEHDINVITWHEDEQIKTQTQSARCKNNEFYWVIDLVMAFSSSLQKKQCILHCILHYWCFYLWSAWISVLRPLLSFQEAGQIGWSLPDL